MKKIIRRCQSCRQLIDRNEMIKITLSDKELFINPDSKILGRSVYVCRNLECIKKLIKTKGIKKALKFNNESEIQKIEEKLILLN